MSTMTVRERLLPGVPLEQRRVDVDGVATSILEAGRGHSLVLLRGTQEGGVGWWPVIPRLVEEFRLVVPDLPGLGDSEFGARRLDGRRLTEWLGELIRMTCEEPPTLVGHSLGGAVAARFAVARSERIRRLVLVDALGLGRFRPSRGFLVAMLRGIVRPSAASVERLWGQAMYDLDKVREQKGERLDALKDYLASRATQPSVKKAMRQLGKSGTKAIPDDELRGIDVPTALVWGRYDRATPLRIAETASERFGWPLHVIDDAGHIPYVEQTDAFVDVLRATVAAGDPAPEKRRSDPARR